jgi:uncharacterized membrane protein (DUF106 family)
MSFLDVIFDPIFGPLLRIHPFLAILIISLGITLIITIVYKYTTNQKEMHKLKKEMKDYQKQLRTVAKTDPKKAMTIQKKAMENNFTYMKHSLKATLITFIPLILIFGWLNAHMAYKEIQPQQEFTVTATFDKYLISNASISVNPGLTITTPTEVPITTGIAEWKMKGDAGQYTLVIKEGNRQYNKNILISTERKYENPLEMYKDASLKKVTIGNERIWPFGSWFNIFGWHPGWLGTYILLSVGASLGLRKLMHLA